MLAKKMIDVVNAYVLGAKMICLSGKPVFVKSILAKANLPTIVSPKPNTSCNEPTIQYHGPNIVQGFLENVLNNVMTNNNNQIKANTNMPINKPNETYPTP